MHEAPQVQVELLRKCLGFGQVFSYDAYVILFCSTEELSCDEIEREVAYAKTAFVYGISTAISYPKRTKALPICGTG